MGTPAIEALIKRAQAGDKAAVGALYQHYADQIYRYIYYRVPTQNDAEDLTGEVFLNMLKALPNYEITGAPFESWLYRIATARIANFYRKKGNRPVNELSETLADTGDLPEERLHRQEEMQHLREVLQKLNPEHQEILILRFVERKSHEEVAAILGKNVSAVRTAQHRALTRLARLLGSADKARHYLRGDTNE